MARKPTKMVLIFVDFPIGEYGGLFEYGLLDFATRKA